MIVRWKIMVDCTLERLYMEDYTVEELYVAFTVESSNMKDSHCGKTFYGGLYCESPILWTIALLTSIWRIVLRKVIDMDKILLKNLNIWKSRLWNTVLRRTEQLKYQPLIGATVAITVMVKEIKKQHNRLIKMTGMIKLGEMGQFCSFAPKRSNSRV